MYITKLLDRSKNWEIELKKMFRVSEIVIDASTTRPVKGEILGYADDGVSCYILPEHQNGYTLRKCDMRCLLPADSMHPIWKDKTILDGVENKEEIYKLLF